MDTKEEDVAPTWDYIFHQLSCDPISHIFSFLNFRNLSSNSTVCMEWYQNIISNHRLWIALCQSFWCNKYVPVQYRQLLQHKEPCDTRPVSGDHLATECSARKAFRLAYIDRTRTVLTVDELLQFRWYFRFKEEAGEMWLNMDPFWSRDSDEEKDEENDSEAKFNWNHTENHNEDDVNEMIQYEPSDLIGILTDAEIEEHKLKQLKYQPTKHQKPLTEHEKRLSRCTRIQFHRDGRMEWQQNNRMMEVINTQDFKWRFGGSFSRETLFGDVLQVNDYPKKYISRHPTNWGFVMQSCWVIYTSFPMPMIDSADDQLINNDQSTMSSYVEMIQYNYMGGVAMRQRTNVDHNEDGGAKWINDEGMFDLEYLKHVKQNQQDGKDEINENDIGLQYVIANFLQSYNRD